MKRVAVLIAALVAALVVALVAARITVLTGSSAGDRRPCASMRDVVWGHRRDGGYSLRGASTSVKTVINKLLAVLLTLTLVACAFEGSEGNIPPDENGTGIPGGGSPGGGGGVIDTDQDGVGDSVDNCRNLANSEQYNEDADPLGDACDNCPHVANPDQFDVGEVNAGATKDGVGDACDPNPMLSGDRLALFIGFNKPTDFNGWQVAGEQDFAIAGGTLRNRETDDLALAWNNNLDLRDATLVSKIKYVALSTTYQFRGVAIMGRFNRTSNLGTGVGCGELRDTSISSPFLNAVEYNGPAFTHQRFGNVSLAAGATSVYTTRLVSGAVTCSTGATSWSRTSSFNGTGVAFSVWGASVDIDYLVAYKR
jgi:hypothetical protein